MWAAPGAPAYSPPVSVTPPPSQTASGSGDDSPRASAARGHSLRTRLAVGILGLMFIMSALMGVFSTLTLRHTLMDRLDTQLLAANERAAVRRHDIEDRPTQAQDSGGAISPESRPAQDPPAGLDAAGQSTGTLSVVASPSGAVKAGYIDAHGVYQNLSSEEISDLLSLKVTGRPVSTSVASLGEYRVLVSEESETGKIVITGLSMASDNELIRTQLLVEAIIAGIGAVIAATVGRSMVRASLGPLERVAATAERVASQPLAHGEVRIDERVDDEDLSSSQEVGQVGTALSILLDHVDSALAARQRSETQVRQFVADASHELRTPLASIRGYTELIQREGGDVELPVSAVHALDRVRSEAVRMTGLVEDLLLLARLEAGRELRYQETNLLGILLDTVADARAAGPNQQWELDLSALADAPAQGSSSQDSDEAAEAEDGEEAELPALMVDEARLRQVFVNLLTNARVHTPAGTHVVTSLRYDTRPVPPQPAVMEDNAWAPEPCRARRPSGTWSSRSQTMAQGSAQPSGTGSSCVLPAVTPHASGAPAQRAWACASRWPSSRRTAASSPSTRSGPRTPPRESTAPPSRSTCPRPRSATP